MEKKRFIFFLLFFFLPLNFYSQGFRLTRPGLNFDGSQLMISYDLTSNNQKELFYVWVEIEKKNGEALPATRLNGEVGEHIRPGSSKSITWIPEADNVYLNEEVFVEVKAERYIPSFKKGQAMLLSAALPGLGQSRIYNGSPWWLTGVTAYGAIAGGLIANMGYVNTYDSYRTEDDPVKRVDLLTTAQQQKDISTALIASGAAIWAVNMIWAAVVPQRYQPLRHAPLSFNPSIEPQRGDALLTLKFNF